MRTKRLWLRILLTSVLILSLLVGMFGFENKEAQARTLGDGTMPTIAYTNKEGEQILAPDFSSLTFGKLPPIEEAGWIDIPKEFVKRLGYDPSRVWGELANVADVVKLGDIEDALGVGKFSLDAIAKITQLDLDQVALSAVEEIVGQQSIGDLVKAIPDLGGLDVGRVKPIADLLGQVGGGDWNERIGTLVQNEAVASLPLGKHLDLSKYGIDSIPGLVNSPLESFKAWGQSSVTGVLGNLGLASVPFASFPIPLLNGAIKVGKVDVVWGSAEHGDPQVPPDLYISGAVKDKSDRTTPVPCTADKSCPYIELTDSINPNKASDKVGDAFKSLHGKRWVVGGNNGMKVKEGYGPLKKLNGGWGAAGITVFGADFGKIALTSTDESTGRAKFSLYLRACARIPFVGKSCSPYFIGPIPFPFLNTKEKGFVLVASTAKPKVDIPSKYADQVAQIQQQYQPQPESSYVDDCVTGVTGDAVNKAISAAPEEMRRYVSKTVPLVLAAAKKYGVTDPAQVAYMLSTVQTETTMGANVVEGATRNKSAPGSAYYGRGFVQLTSADNYRKASKIVGVDLVKNPERATEPEIAAKILVVGMRDGVFTGRKLSDFINNGKANFVGARQIVNDSDKQIAMAQDANRYLKAIGGSSVNELKETGSTCSTTIASGPIGQRILQASQKAYGMDTSAGPGGGNVACAWAVNKILNQAGIKTIGSNPNVVFSVRDALEAGRGQQVARSQAEPGDLVLALGAGSRQHIGICQNNGCTQVLSNSSSKASFTWKSNTDFGGFYGVPSKIYRVTK